jgi:DNA-binding MarR family transcriptional regulator
MAKSWLVREGRRFIIKPLTWSLDAARIPGKVSIVGDLIWHQVGIRRSLVIKLSTELLRKAGISRPALQHALHALEVEGLVEVERNPGRKSIITVLSSDLAEEELKKSPEPHEAADEDADDDGDNDSDDDLSRYLPPDLPALPPRGENPFAHIRIVKVRNAALIEAEVRRVRDRRERKRREKRTRKQQALPEAE